jgi:prepilin-type N-terminal cleavage/methylation domain-containing protein
MKPPLTYKPRCAAGHLTSDLRSLTSGRGRGYGFTLIELLAVIVLISMLLGLLFGAAQFVVKNARARRAESTASALQVALCAYRHEYGKWPIPEEDAELFTALNSNTNDFPGTGWIVSNNDGSRCVTFQGNHNYLVFDRLRACTNTPPTPPAANTNNIRFVDDSTLFAEDTLDSRQRIQRYKLPSDGSGLIQPGHPIVYMTKDGATEYYEVRIWFELDKVRVKQQSENW